MSFFGLAAAGIIGAGISASGAESAAQTQAGAAERAQQISQQEFNTITTQEQPFMQGGYGALNALEFGMGTGGTGPNGQPGAGQAGYGALNAPFTQQTFQQYSPAYQFQLQQGQAGVLNADTSGQGALSGAALKDLTGFNQNYANTAFNNAFNQYQTQQQNIYGRLAGLVNTGSSAAANLGAQGVQLAGQQAQSATNIGTALAGGTVGAANAIGGGITNAGSLYSLSSLMNPNSNPQSYLGLNQPSSGYDETAGAGDY
jgi:hypothetical protein